MNSVLITYLLDTWNFLARLGALPDVDLRVYAENVPQTNGT